MSRTIVCGVDRSDGAEAVVDVANWLANRLASRLALIHVVEESRREADALVAFLRGRPGLEDLDDVRVLTGDPAKCLIQAAGRDSADLLVVGSRGRSSIRSAILGSVSRSLATSAPCPVVIVPEGVDSPAGTGGDESIVCGVDGSEHAVAAARLAAELAERMGIRLLVVHALQDVRSFTSYPGARLTVPPLSGQPDARQRQAEQIVETAIDAAGATATGVVEPGTPWEVLESVADRETGRLLVVAARGQNALRAALLGSVAIQLGATARRPLVVLPEPAEETIRTRAAA